MSREKLFDVDDALDRAADVFWAKGYQAASMADLINGMGINKGSLYNAFGSKKELFKRVLIKFEQDHQIPTLARLEALDDPVAAISTLFDSLIAQSVTDAEKKGNLIVNTALELPNHDEDVGEIVRSATGRLEAFFKGLVELGQQRGDIGKDINAEITAKSLLTLTVGLRVLARGTFDATGLLAIKSSALTLIGH